MMLLTLVYAIISLSSLRNSSTFAFSANTLTKHSYIDQNINQYHPWRSWHKSYRFSPPNYDDKNNDNILTGLGVGEKSIAFRDLNKSEITNPYLSTNDENPDKSITESKEEARTLEPKAVIQFLIPTLALWLAPPIMSLIDTSMVGRFCGPTDLAGKYPFLRLYSIYIWFNKILRVIFNYSFIDIPFFLVSYFLLLKIEYTKI